VRVTDGRVWHLYFSLGRLVWAAGGDHARRRWRRQLHRYAPELPFEQVERSERSRHGASECSDYELLAYLAERRVLDGRVVTAIVHSTLDEVVFDLVQQTESLSVQQAAPEREDGSFELATLDTLEGVGGGFALRVREGARPAALARLPHTWMQPVAAARQRTESAWKQWVATGLDASPNLAPHVGQPAQLRELTNPVTYRNLIAALDGRRTLRDVSVALERDTEAIARALAPYVRRGVVQLRSVPDLMPPQPATPPAVPVATSEAAVRDPLIACVDDSPHTRQLVESIVTASGCQFLGVANAIDAPPQLVEYQPDLIFLDLVLPEINGYDLCGQIRRVSLLQAVPTVILTANVIDKVRARVAGASGSLLKPVTVEKIRTALGKYHLLAPTPARLS